MPSLNTLLYTEGAAGVPGLDPRAKKKVNTNTVMTAANGKGLTPGATEGLTPHKGHFHTATGQKVAGGGFTTENPGERLFKHKDHFHTEQTDDKDTIKVGGPGTINPETGELEYGHKGHAHSETGERIPGSTNPDLVDPLEEGAPTEEEAMRASLAAQRKALRKGMLKGRLSTIMASKFKATDQLG